MPEIVFTPQAFEEYLVAGLGSNHRNAPRIVQ